MDGFRTSLYNSFRKQLGHSHLTEGHEGRTKTTRKDWEKFSRSTLCQTPESVIFPETDAADESSDDCHEILPVRSQNPVEEEENLLKRTTIWYSEEIHPDEAQGKRHRCIKNLILHSLATMLVYIPYMTLQHLQLGVISQAAGYMALLASCFASPLIVHLLGYKRTMILCFATHLLFVLSNLIPTVKAAFPTRILVGFASGPFWTAQGSYVALLASEYSEYGHTDLRSTTCAFFGIFFVFYHASRILGRPVAYLLLSEKYQGEVHNETLKEQSPNDEGNYNNGTIISTCGKYFCSSDQYLSVTTETTYDRSAIHVFAACYIVLCVLALVITIVFLDDKRPLGEAPRMNLCDLARSTAYMHCKETLLLMLPLLVYTGLEHVFIHWDYPNAFVRCSSGFLAVGPILLMLGLTETASTVVIGFLQTYPKCRFSLLELASFINIILLGVAKSTDTASWAAAHYFIFAFFWGICHAIWQTSVCGE